MVTDWVFVRTDWAEFIAHVEVFWQDESYAAGAWTSQVNGDPVLYDDVVLDERTIVNARIGIDNVELGNGTLRAALWGKNVFGQDYPTFGINFTQGVVVTEQYAEEASFGLDVTYEF